MGEGLAEWTVTEPGGRRMALQMAYFDRGHEPVIMEFGPVLDLEDVIGGKICALAGRTMPRDYLDTAAALARYTPAELIDLAQRLDPGLEGEDFADAARRLDQLPDSYFAQFGVDEASVGELRERFADWPREAEARRDPGPSPEWDEPNPGGFEEAAEPSPAPASDASPPATAVAPEAEAAAGEDLEPELEL